MQKEHPQNVLAFMQRQLRNMEFSSKQDPMDNARQDSGEAGFYWTLEELLQGAEGTLLGTLAELGEVHFDSISTDTRTLQPGALYIAIKGEHFDGHDFVSEAVKQGAAAVLVSEAVDTIVPGVLVEDTRLALGQFAQWHRRRMPLKKLIAITGSNGKTTVKGMLLNIFSEVGRTLATQGNLNNDFGVPRTLLELRPEHEYAIIEMGANHLKEIEYLSLMAEPDIALLNNASGAHLEGFGSLQGVIEAKGEIFLGLNRLNQGGVAVINTDSPGFEYWLSQLQHLEVERIWRFGESKQADVCLSDYQSLGDRIGFDLLVNQQKQTVTMPLLGKHNALNAAACAAVALAAGLDWKFILTGLQNFSGVAGRLHKRKIGQGWLIDDSYNANPESVKAAIQTLSSLPGESMLCLGVMAELGLESAASHAMIAEYARSQGLKYLFVTGDATRKMPSLFGEKGEWFADHERMAQQILQRILSGEVDNVLVKGSRSAKMEKVVELIQQGLSRHGHTKDEDTKG
ncbi:MAG: UDP-N-acetylmuramoyl-tripeptide--D-alanyl-D-alanine ligase [Thiomicrorhabdus chilensis]|uniref:UDP-N-acetylmuramoyl-tripeptide--D-alanyl-D- alanine ligase n=1 Tax=Thiomicrorhabdus chilensis TaxID=63656 RepID=UPI00299F3115|nr:UDP-N-acetylmuramoyl-tripeptide--D-alanyl-D-alanine ligase [Thiomicrorhabdus chilensis]MDX1346682.1 UDP-N-acetylmuramoyl-tripeptide--D-alanyl-D-alanine ligase [Thiomicrorhabdus chilensis]